MSNEFLSPWENVAADVFEECRKDGITLDPEHPGTAFARSSWLRKKALEMNTCFTSLDPIH